MIKLFPHQQTALDETKSLTNVAYYLDMGLGKTFVGSEKAKQLGEQINLIVCQKSLIETWTNHFVEHYPEFEVYEDADQRENTMANLTGGMEVARYLSGEMKLEELLGLWDEQQQSFDEKVDSLRIYR